MSDDLDVAAVQRAAELALSTGEYRRTYERADFLVLNSFQRRLLESVSHNRFVLGRCGGQVGKSTAAMYLVEGVATGQRPLTNRATPTLERAHKIVIWILSEFGQTTIWGRKPGSSGPTPMRLVLACCRFAVSSAAMAPMVSLASYRMLISSWMMAARASSASASSFKEKRRSLRRPSI